jgi:hypothetical protein
MAQTTNANLSFFNATSGGTFDIPYVEVTGFERNIVKGSDGRTAIGVQSVLRGRGVFASASAYADFRDTLRAAKGAGDPVNFTCKIRKPGGSYVPLLVYDALVTDDIGGPFIETQATEVVGDGCVIAAFSIVTQSAIPDDDGSNFPVPVVGHVWTQVSRIGPDGRIQRFVRGLVTCAPGMDAAGQDDSPSPNATSAEWITRRPYPDLFRFAIAPDVPGAGWRRILQEYAYTNTGNALAYQYTDEQFLHDLPWPAISGDMDFEFERTQKDAGTANLRANVELWGGMATDIRQLVACAFDLLAARITPSRDMILRMVVREKGIITQPHIEVELEALTWSQNLAATATLPLGSMIGSTLWVGRETCSRTIPPYGSGAPIINSSSPHENLAPESLSNWWMDPHWLSNELTMQTTASTATAMPQASLTEFLSDVCPGTIQIYRVNVDPDNFIAAMNTAVVGTTASQQPPYPGQYPKQTDGETSGVFCPTTVLQGFSETRVTLNTGMGRMSTAYSAGADFIFQVEKPVVLLVEKAIITRMNQNPPKHFRAAPAGYIVLEEKWNPTPGQGDPQGMRSYSWAGVRICMAYDAGGTTTNGFASATIGSVTARKWTPPGGYVLGALNDMFDGDSQIATLSVLPTAAQLASLTDTKIASAIAASPVVT